MGRVILRRVAVAAGGPGAAVALVASAATAQQTRHVIPGAKLAWAADAHQNRPVPAPKQLSVKVWLAPRNADALTTLAQSVSDPVSAQYQQFITPAQYRAQFAPSAAQVSTVSQWLASTGLTVGQVGPDAHYIAASGPAAAVA